MCIAYIGCSARSRTDELIWKYHHANMESLIWCCHCCPWRRRRWLFVVFSLHFIITTVLECGCQDVNFDVHEKIRALSCTTLQLTINNHADNFKFVTFCCYSRNSTSIFWQFHNFREFLVGHVGISYLHLTWLCWLKSKSAHFSIFYLFCSHLVDPTIWWWKAVHCTLTVQTNIYSHLPTNAIHSRTVKRHRHKSS